ncbi:ATPase AAA [Thermincola ferriacetica]|uniref:ATPase AAA n=1 Tax=Thermincola ferriacetica TaxID=281456 RepID=A0A0L6W2S6_9FIRM|nr:CbbQ/NirQ/NorQ/GpvN family protein [Thermincola ferriacetica]KNZ69384.1 ATPase AAA [Thermincola ferriacetica]
MAKRLLEHKIGEFFIEEEPFYIPLGKEIEMFEKAFKSKLPVMLKGPTGCGKTRFLQYMAYCLKRPLITVACHEDLTTSDLVGRYLLKGSETVWTDGPLTTAVKIGAICYLDEVVEARKDTTVVIHPLTDDRRVLPIEKKGEIITAPDEFMLVVSYNPGYQTFLKDLKQSTKQRFIAMDFDYPKPELEQQILIRESGVDNATAGKLIELAQKIRNLKNRGLEEGVSTRLLIYAGQLIVNGIDVMEAVRAAMIKPITDDAAMQMSLEEIAVSIFI